MCFLEMLVYGEIYRLYLILSHFIVDVKLHYRHWSHDERLTYDFHFVGGVDLSGSVGHVAGVLPAVLRCQVLQTQGPPLLLPFLPPCAAAALVHQRPAVLQPDDVGPRVPAGRALQPHRAAHRPGDDALPHLGRLGETWTHCEWGEDARS